MSWTQPLCDDCWDKRDPSRPSQRRGEGCDEQCALCGETTWSGIYVRIDPATVPFPSEETP